MCDSKLTEKLLRTTESILIVALDEEEKYRSENQFKIKKHIEEEDHHRCTICKEIISKCPYLHPALRVLVCTKCISRYDKSTFPRGIDGVDENCRWCAEAAPKFNCNLCTCTFCEVRITLYLLFYISNLQSKN